MKILVLVMMLATTAPALAQTGTETGVKIPAIETTYMTTPKIKRRCG